MNFSLDGEVLRVRLNGAFEQLDLDKEVMCWEGGDTGAPSSAGVCSADRGFETKVRPNGPLLSLGMLFAR